MSIQIENANKPASITLERIEQLREVAPPQQSVVVQDTVRYTQTKPIYNISIVDSFGGFFILAAAILLVIKLFGGTDTFGSIIKGVVTVVGGAILFVYAFGMAVL